MSKIKLLYSGYVGESEDYEDSYLVKIMYYDEDNNYIKYIIPYLCYQVDNGFAK